MASPAVGSPVSGIADIAFLGNRLYALLTGAGCSHDVPDISNGILRVNDDGSTTMIANLSAFYQANPVARPNADDFEPDGTPYSLVDFGGALYAVEPNHGELDRISRDGQISRVIDISASQGHVVPTACVFHAGNFYVGTLMPFPARPVAKVYQITREGNISVVAEGLTTVLGVAFRNNELYVLETSAPVTSPGPPLLPGTGRVVRVTDSGALEPVVTGLMFPTAMTFSPNGDLYISNFGFGFPPGAGQIVKVELPHGKGED
jgi:sugar lactone lactonase YvrE